MSKLNFERLEEAVGVRGPLGSTSPALLTPGLLESVIDTLPEPVYLLDRQHRLICCNDAFCAYVDSTRATLLGKTSRDFLPSIEAGQAWDNDELVFASGSGLLNEVVVVDGEARSRVLQTCKSVLGKAGPHALLLGIIRDTTGTDEARALLHGERAPGDLSTALGRRIKHLGIQQVRFAFSDPLTQLPNRRVSMNLLEAMSQRGLDHAAILVINIDHFNLVNDRFGYAAGDTVILKAAARLKVALGDDFSLGRLDNDAFIVLAEDLDDLGADRLAERLLNCVAPPLMLGDYRYRMSVSIGIAMFPEHGRNAEALLRNAGIALRWCKQRQRGRYEHYSETVSVAANRRATIELKLIEALEQGRLTLNYQAIVDAERLSTVGFEALTRWHDPTLGELNPDEFIPVAEDMGLCRALGENVLQAACAFIARLEDEEQFVSVNISSSQLLDATFPIFVAETLQQFGVSGERLILEITETVAMEADPTVRQVFHELSGIGLRLFIDDFGTGFSNLARLKELPFAGIKIDREFVCNLPRSSEDAAIFRATYAIAQAMNLAVVVEGVETAEQQAFIRCYDVEYLQGFRFGHALPPAEIAGYLP